ncbi:DUF764 family protein [Borrelia hispanica]|uniref:DUF764 family protein n=1 Tax=Borrelia hispanica TaxID=40835 RepID=UPI0004640ED2|nr:DUF764 family protein [Borrelia hispanica]
MILDITTIEKCIISTLKDFIKFASIYNLSVDIINTYNHPYMSKYTVDNSNIIAVQFTDIDGLFEHNSRTGVFYNNVNEFAIHFQLYFMALTSNSNKDAYERLMLLYALFSDFLHDSATQSFTFTPEDNCDYQKNLKFHIRHTTNMQNNGLLDVNSNHSKSTYCLSQGFIANIQIKEEKVKEQNNAI